MGARGVCELKAASESPSKKYQCYCFFFLVQVGHFLFVL